VDDVDAVIAQRALCGSQPAADVDVEGDDQNAGNNWSAH
jgi:hypothetical protein